MSITGIKPIPEGHWMSQIARNLVDEDDGFLCSKTHLILDRDPLYTAQLRSILMSGDVQVVRLPPRSPNLNAFAERFVLSIKSECLNRVIPLGERNLRKVIDEYVEHYHLERLHQGLDNQLIEGVLKTIDGSVKCRERLGGLLNSYCREAA